MPSKDKDVEMKDAEKEEEKKQEGQDGDKKDDDDKKEVILSFLFHVKYPPPCLSIVLIRS